MAVRITVFLLLLSAAASSCRADDLVGARTLAADDYADDGALEREDGQERFLFTSTSTVTVNSTLLRAIGAIIGALLLALPLYLAYATAAGAGTGGGYGYKRSGRFKRASDDEGENLSKEKKTDSAAVP